MSIFRADKKFEKFEDVTPELLKKEDVKLLLCDLDELQDWVEECRKAGVKIVIISNNGRKKMMQKFCEPIKVDCVWWAKKPMSKKLTEAMKEYKVPHKNTVMLGDKWSTDVLAAKAAGIRSYKVEHRRDII